MANSGAIKRLPTSLATRVYLFIWSISMLFPLIDLSIFGPGIGALDTRPLVDEDYRYLFPTIYALLGSLIVSNYPDQSSIRPTTTILACVAHALDLYIRWKRMPIVWDHEQWAMQIELAFLLIFAPTCLAPSAEHVAWAEQAFFAIARLQFVVFYAAATFWKFNSNFFDPTVSCGTVLIVETISGYLPFILTDSVTVALGAISPHLTALVEGAIAFTMAFSTLRDLAVVFATVFHLTIFLLPVNSAGGFSMDCATRFIVFFSTAELTHFVANMSWRKEFIITALASLGLILLRMERTGAPFDFAFLGMCCLTVFYVRLVLSCRTAGKLSASNTGRNPSGGYQTCTMVVVILLAMLYGFGTVILGLQQMGAPSMYSNLRYYGERNHYLVPTGILSDDLIYGGGIVQILESTSPALNRRLAYIPSEDVFPPTVLSKIRVATTSETSPVQFFPFCLSNPHSRKVLSDVYEPSNPVGSSNFVPFLLPISEVRKALRDQKPEEETYAESSFVIRLVDAGTSDNLQEKPSDSPSNRVIVITQDNCEIHEDDAVEDCTNDRVAQLIVGPSPPETSWITRLAEKLLTPYPQFTGMKAEICIS